MSKKKRNKTGQEQQKFAQGKKEVTGGKQGDKNSQNKKQDFKQDKKSDTNKQKGLQNVVKKDQDEKRESMLAKTKKSLSKQSRVSAGTIVGVGVVLLILLACLVGLVLVVVTRISPRLDKDLEAPILNDMPKYTNEKSIVVSGKTMVDGTDVFVYVNGERASQLLKVDNDSTFTYEYNFAEEGSYDFSAVAIKSGLLRNRSEGSKVITVVFDSTPTSSDVELNYPDEVSEDNFDLKGVVGSEETVVLEKDGDVYYAEADTDGKFKVVDIAVKPGENEFTVSLEDKAGNTTDLGGVVNVLYGSGSINGDGVSTTAEAGGELPNSAGELEDAMSALGLNNMMILAGLLALILFVVNSTVVGVKLLKQRVS